MSLLLGCHVFHLCIVFILSTTIPILFVDSHLKLSAITNNIDMTVITNLIEQIALAGDHQYDNEHNQPGGHTSNKLSLAKQSAQKIIRVILHLNIENKMITAFGNRGAHL